MAISYDLAVQQLLALGHELATNRKFDLDHMRVLAAALEHPERRFQSVLIAGNQRQRLNRGHNRQHCFRLRLSNGTLYFAALDAHQ